MAFKDYGSPRVDTWLTIGGTDKKGKKNPETFEGYYVGSQEGPSLFDDSKTKTTYLFKTANGIIGVNGSANLINRMRDAEKNYMAREGKAPIGANTLITFTGTVNLGKGNPMKTFTVQFDKDDVIEVDSLPVDSGTDDADEYEDTYESDEDDGNEAVSASTLAAGKNNQRLTKEETHALLKGKARK